MIPQTNTHMTFWSNEMSNLSNFVTTIQFIISELIKPQLHVKLIQLQQFFRSILPPKITESIQNGKLIIKNLLNRNETQIAMAISLIPIATIALVTITITLMIWWPIILVTLSSLILQLSISSSILNNDIFLNRDKFYLFSSLIIQSLFLIPSYLFSPLILFCLICTFSWNFCRKLKTLIFFPFCAFGLLTTPYWTFIWMLTFPIIYISMLMIQLCATILLITNSKIISKKHIETFLSKKNEYQLQMRIEKVQIISESVGTMSLESSDWGMKKHFIE